MEKTILIVDDEKMITTTLATLIKITLKYNVIVSNDPLEVLDSGILTEKPIDLVISDFMMPKMNGIEFLKNVIGINPGIVTILLTGYADKENAIKSINEIGLYYYLEKPWSNNELIKIIQNGLERKRLSDELNKKVLELQQSNEEIARLYELLQKDLNQEVENVKSVILSLANVIEAKDKYTDGHTRRVGMISRHIGEKLSLSPEQLENLEISGIIHDIGKVGVSEAILNKPGKLTEEEFEIMKNHSHLGEMICKPLNCLKDCLGPIRHHHEKLDGSGYPDGLKGEEISIETRILTVADVFDALYSKRPYRDKMPVDKVREIMWDEVRKGCFDEQVVSVLFDMVEKNELPFDNQ